MEFDSKFIIQHDNKLSYLLNLIQKKKKKNMIIIFIRCLIPIFSQFSTLFFSFLNQDIILIRLNNY